MKFRQIEPTAWRKGLEIAHLAVIAREPADLAERWGLQFSAHVDELGLCKTALIETQSGRQYALLYYEWVADRDRGILVKTRSDAGDLTSALEEVLESLDLAVADLKWQHPDIRLRPWALWRQDEPRAQIPGSGGLL